LKIVNIEKWVVGVPGNPGINWIFLKLVTDEGIEGAGECTNWSGRDLTISQCVDELGKAYVVGQDPFDIERLCQRIYAAWHDFHKPSMIETPVMSAFEMACWDIIGKKLNQPVYNLLGGKFNEKLRAYSGMPVGTPEETANKAAELVEQGFTGVKFDPLGPIYPCPRSIDLKTLQYAEDCVKAVRDAVGNSCDILFETHGKLNTHSAIRLAKRLEKYEPLFIEEPVPPENVDEMARVAKATSIPIATGERLLTKYEFVEIFQKQAAAIIQLDVSHCGGILEAKKIAAMAEAHYAQIAPHKPYGPVAGAAAIQLDVTCPNFLIQEGGAWTGFNREVLKEPIAFEKGYLIPPTKPGLGVELDEEVLNRHPYVAPRAFM